MKTSEHGIELIKGREGFRAVAYPDPATNGDPWTVGFGSTHGVHPGMTVTKQQAHDMLMRDLHLFEAAVEHGVTVEINQDQFDALVSLCYNIGPRNFLGSTVLRRLNAGDVYGAADAMLMWDKANHKVMAGLHHRREDERDEFLGEA